MGGPPFAGAAGSFGDQDRQLGPVGHRERDVCAAATAGRSAIRLRRKVPAWEKPDVECGQRELLAASSVRPAERLRDGDVDCQGAHVEGDVAAHGRVVSREPTPAHGSCRTGARSQRLVGLIRDALGFFGVVVTAVVSRRPVRPLADEAERLLPGDEQVPGAKVGWTHAITIRARPAEIWPWLVQMGCRRAGWYSYDGLDNAGAPSADRIIAEFQQVQVSDVFPQMPTAEDRFVVRAVEPERALVLGDDAGSMSSAFVLEPVDESSTRLNHPV